MKGTSVGPPDPDLLPNTDIRKLVVIELAAVRALSLEEMDQEIADSEVELEVDSKEAEVILARLEVHFGCKLPAVSDLRPEQLNSIETLTFLVMRRVAEIVSEPHLGTRIENGMDVRNAERRPMDTKGGSSHGSNG